jgi:alkylhydroperoxidase/carboxymuconolactone decarboxylase family protein YurZ
VVDYLGIRPPSHAELAAMTSEEVLRRLTIADPAYCRALMSSGSDASSLDARSVALVCLGGSIAAGSVGPMWRQRVTEALDAGLSFDEIVASLAVLAPTIGIERTVAVAPELARALGYDIDAELERLDDGMTIARPRQPRQQPVDG